MDRLPGGRGRGDVQFEVLPRELRPRRDVRRPAEAPTVSLDSGEELPGIRLRLHHLREDHAGWRCAAPDGTEGRSGPLRCAGRGIPHPPRGTREEADETI